MFFVIGVIREPIHVHQLIWYSVFSFNSLFSWKSQMFVRALPDNCLQTRPLGGSRQLLLFAHAAIVFLLLTKLQFSHVPNNKQLQLSLLETSRLVASVCISVASRWVGHPVSWSAPPRWQTGSVELYFQPHWAHFQSSREEKQAACKTSLVAPDAWTTHQHQWPSNETGNTGSRLCLHLCGYFKKNTIFQPLVKKQQQIPVHTLTVF